MKKEKDPDKDGDNDAKPHDEEKEKLAGRLRTYNKGKAKGRQIKDPFKMAETIGNLKKNRGCK